MAYSYSGARNAVPQDPNTADCDPIRWMRSVAVLGVIFGCAGVISFPFGLLRLHQGSFAGDLRVSLFSPMIESPSGDAMWLYCSSVAGTGLMLMLLIGSILARSLHPLARPILMLWAIGSLVVFVGGSYFYFRWLLPPWRDQLPQVRGVVGTMVSFAGWGISITLAVAMLWLLTRPSVEDAFHRGRQV